MLASMIGLSIIPLTLSKISANNRAIALVLILLSGVVAIKYVPTTLIQRFATTTTEVQDARLGGRFKLWVAGVKAFTYRPVVGYGPVSFKRAIDPFLYQESQVAHNSYLSVLVEEGLVGFVLFMMMIVSTYFAVLKLSGADRRFALVLLATMMITMLPLTWEDRKQAWVVMAILVGMAQSRMLVRPAFRQQVPRPRNLAAAGPLGPGRAARTMGGPIRRPPRDLGT
jgi:O-antigen ligase